MDTPILRAPIGELVARKPSSLTEIGYVGLDEARIRHGMAGRGNVATYINKHKTHDAIHSQVQSSKIFEETNLLGNTAETQPLLGVKTTPKLYPLGFGWPGRM